MSASESLLLLFSSPDAGYGRDHWSSGHFVIITFTSRCIRINLLTLKLATAASFAATFLHHALLPVGCKFPRMPDDSLLSPHIPDSFTRFAFVEYESRRDADDAYHEMHNKRMGRDDLLKIEVNLFPLLPHFGRCFNLAFSGLVPPLLPPGDSTRVVTAVVTALLLAVAAPPPHAAAAVTTLRDGTIATNGITIVQTVTTSAVTVIATMIAATAMIAVTVTGSVLATDPAALKTGSAMPRMIVSDATMIASAVKRSARPFPTVKTGKVCIRPSRPSR